MRMTPYDLIKPLFHTTYFLLDLSIIIGFTDIAVTNGDHVILHRRLVSPLAMIQMPAAISPHCKMGRFPSTLPSTYVIRTFWV